MARSSHLRAERVSIAGIRRRGATAFTRAFLADQYGLDRDGDGVGCD